MSRQTETALWVAVCGLVEHIECDSMFRRFLQINCYQYALRVGCPVDDHLIDAVWDDVMTAYDRAYELQNDVNTAEDM